MRFIYCAILNVLSLALFSQHLTVADLRCEYANSPVGIEIITPGLSSLHYILRLYNGLAGISQDSSSIAYKHTVIRPQAVGDVDHAETSFNSPYGLIKSSWKKTTHNKKK